MKSITLLHLTLLSIIAITAAAIANNEPTDKAQNTKTNLQIINASKEKAEIYSLDKEGNEILNSKIPSGKIKVLSTSLGDKHVILGQESKTRITVESTLPHQATRYAPEEKNNTPDFYTQRIKANGFPIVASANVDPYALKEAAYILDSMLQKRDDIRKIMIKSGARLCIIAHNEYTTDLPDFAHFASFPRYHIGVSSKDYWDVRARGTGGSDKDPYCSCGEENLLNYPGDPYEKENILIHEFAHSIHLRGLMNLDPTFDTRLKRTYNDAMAAGLWKGKYAATNHHEYFAEGVQSWFGNNRENDSSHNHVNTRAELLKYDPGLAAICREVFKDTVFTYTKPITRLTGHMQGYDPSKAPEFQWPERLIKIKNKIGLSSRK